MKFNEICWIELKSDGLDWLFDAAIINLVAGDSDDKLKLA